MTPALSEVAEAIDGTVCVRRWGQSAVPVGVFVLVPTLGPQTGRRRPEQGWTCREQGDTAGVFLGGAPRGVGGGPWQGGI